MFLFVIDNCGVFYVLIKSVFFLSVILRFLSNVIILKLHLFCDAIKHNCVKTNEVKLNNN